MAGSDVTSVYRSIIDEVVTKSRHEFVQEGVDEAVLEELRVLWEEKLQQTGVLSPEPPRLPGGGGQGIHTGYAQPLPHNYAAYYARAPTTPLGRPSSYMAPTGYGGAGLMPSRPGATYGMQQTQLGAPLQGASASQLQQYATSQGLLHFIQGYQHAHAGPNAQQPPALVQAPPQHVLHQHVPPVRAAQLPHQQQAGALSVVVNGGVAHPEADPDVPRKRKAEELQGTGLAEQQAPSMQKTAYGAIPQQDGSGDAHPDAGEAEAGGDGAEAEPAVDNLSDVPSSDGEEEEEIANHCISQYTKVTRTKNRWKAQLLAGILHLNGRDHIFHSAIGEFQF